jgi:tetratricopeptide (TPR) repeat protein
MAVEAFRQATLARPDYAEAWAYLGEARQHFKTGSTSTDDGLSDLQKALSIDPASLSTNLFLAIYWQRQERYDQALTYLGVAAKLDPDNPTLETELGKTLAAAGDLPAAQGHYLRAVELAPKDATYWRILAEFSLQYRIQIRQIALPASRQAVILTPDDPRALDLMGQALFMLDDTLNAERFLLRALQTDPGYAPAHLHLGQVYLLEGEAERARQQLDTALALSPDTPTADQAQRLLQRYFP